MEDIPNSCKLLRFHPDTLEAARKELKLDKRMVDESINILESWLKKQTHFVKTDFSRDYLERTLGVSKGSIERSKERLDKLCTYKTLMPQYFVVHDLKKEVSFLGQYIHSAFLPNLTNDHLRIYMSRFNNDNNMESTDIFNFFKFIMVMGEFLRRHELCCGFRIILDFRYINILNLIPKINPVELKNAMTLMIDGYGMRVKSIHILSESKVIDSFISLFKQVLTAKIASRINVHKTLDTLHDSIEEIDVLPEEYGGKELPLAKLSDEWFEVLTSEEHIKYMKEMNKATTNESCRTDNNFNEHYVGMAGSIRALSVD